MKDHVGFGALNEALTVLDPMKFDTVLVVASKNAWQRFKAEARPFFTARHVEVFSDFSINPEFREIQAGAERLQTVKPDLLVALGGGSPMDVAKVMKAMIFSREPFDPENPESIRPSGEGPPLVAIATTAGSGSEATQFAVFYKDDVKQSLAHPSLRPEMAVADPEMSYSLPPDQTAATGFDALSQAVESYWGTRATPESQELAAAAITYILPNLYNAVHSPAPGNRYHMTQAAYLAGKAINITRTTMPHALAYHLTKRYGLSHGHAVALTLPYFFLLNSDPSLPTNSPRTAEENGKMMENLFTLMGQKSGEDCFAFWRNLLRACGLAPSLREAGVDTEDKIRQLVGSMNLVRMANHPVRIEPERLIHSFLRHD